MVFRALCGGGKFDKVNVHNTSFLLAISELVIVALPSDRCGKLQRHVVWKSVMFGLQVVQVAVSCPNSVDKGKRKFKCSTPHGKDYFPDAIIGRVYLKKIFLHTRVGD